MKIDKVVINDKSPCFIIAELSGNHNGKIKNAINAIKYAKKAGADAIKLQTYTADTLTFNCNNKYFRINHGTIWDGTTLYKLYQKAHTPWEWHKELFHIAREEGIICFSSPFDKSAIDLLEELDCPAYKIASPEILDIHLIRDVARTNKPVIISTGIATISDIELAVKTCYKEKNYDIALLKCTSEYPAPLSKANLKTIKDLNKKFNSITGLSDHTLGIISPIVALSYGAKIIEKHFIVDKKIGGPDSSFSLDFNEFKEMVKMIRNAELVMGDIEYKSENSIKKGRGFTGRSLFFVKKIKKNEVISKDHIKSIRPGYGLHPKYLNDIIGKKVIKNINEGTPVNFSLIR